MTRGWVNRARRALSDVAWAAGGGARRIARDCARLFAHPSDHDGYRAHDGFSPRGARDYLKRMFSPARLGLSAASTAMTVFLAASFGVFVLFAPRLPETTDLWDANRPPSLIVYDRKGETIASRGSDYGETVPLEEMPKHLIDAVLATEDRRFYSHRGVDPRGLARAMVANIRSGAIVQGGSTITQQLAKNAFLSSERSGTRKAKEALLAGWIEGRYTKDEILSVYLNRIYLGAGAYGVDAASKVYFDKSVRDLTLQEAAVIAALPKAPSTLAPTKNPEGANRRAAEVIDNMVEDGRLDWETAQFAKAEPARVAETARETAYGYFLDYVVARLDERAEIGLSSDLVVRTTLDARLQAAAEKAVADIVAEDGGDGEFEQAALIAYGTDGGVRAVVGGAAYAESQFNRATQALRQPGSAFKPFVYLAALESGLTPKSIFLDAPIEIDGWRPTNYADTYSGPVRLAEAMGRSINTVSVQVSEAVGRDKVIATARRLGVATEMEPHPSLALGAFETTLETLAGAYIPFANGGMAAEPHVLVSVETPDGEPLFLYEPPDPRPVFPRGYAEDMTHMMHQVMAGGTGRRADIGGGLAVGKTGTTNDWRDAWFVGYGSSLVAGVWVGNDDYSPMNQVTGGDAPARIWRAFMAEAARSESFARLPGTTRAMRFSEERELAQFYTQLADDFRGETSGGLFGR